MSIPQAVSIGPLTISPPLALAPMAGLTHSAFRRLVLSLGGCGLVVTGMVSAAALTPKALRSHHLLDLHPDEHPIAVQISGHDPEQVARAAVLAAEHGADIVDLNAGCPSRQVTGNGSGAALLRDLRRLEAILQRVKRSISIPVTLKFRSGWDEHSIVAGEVARLAESCGCAAITLHPRTRSQGYAGRADWRLIEEVVRGVRIPVFASGDIRTVDDARRCFAETGCAGLMVARAALSNPWILSQMAAALLGEEPPHPTPADRYRFLQQYVRLLQEELAYEPAVLGRFKALVSQMHLGLPGAPALRRQVIRSRTLDEAWTAVEGYFAPYRQKLGDAPEPGR